MALYKCIFIIYLFIYLFIYFEDKWQHMTVFERGSSAVFAFGSLSEIGKSARKSGEQQINNLWPGRFVKDKIYEEISKE